ncbi:rhodanese-like domain-containing protein [Comamonas kerstersii]|uniref:rhodanese-like domain-containing protein n=1 Tax=Comamonas kerstersii TaxID=225992 RepID=UPI003EDFD65B
MLSHSLKWTTLMGVLGAALLTSGCSYVKGFYGGKAQTQTATTAATVLYAPERHYAADISAARAYVSAQLPASQRMALLDVRDATEYRMGHPEGAFHVPYPRIYRQCQPHPSGAEQAQIRSDDGSECRYGVVPGSEVRMSAADFWQAVVDVLPYKDAPIAVLCRNAACAAEAANLLARPDLSVDPKLAGQGYRSVYVIKEGFVGAPMVATDVQTGRVLSTEKKAQAFKQSSGKTQLYAQPSVPVDADNDGKITQADWSGWRNFLGLPYVMSLQPSLLSEAAQSYYEKP